MATEEGVVIKIGGQAKQIAWVKTVQSSACKSCSARHSCNPGTQGKEREVEALNLVGAKVGDLIQISIETGPLLKATFLLYIFPIICLMFGGLAGHRIGTAMGFDSSAAAALLAAICFIGALFIVRLKAGRMTVKTEYRPKITRVIGRVGGPKGAPPPPDDCGMQITSNI